MAGGGWLVGREPEVSALAELIEDADAGRGRTIFITGEPGIGKTSIAEAAEAFARRRGFQVAWGRCTATEMPPYWPWTQVLNGLVGEATLLDPGRFASRPELFAAVAEGIEARSRLRALLVIVEDVHWADRGSVALLDFVAGMVAGQRLLLVITSREDAGVLTSVAGVRRIPLAGLDLEATSALVRKIVVQEPPQAYLAEVHRRSGGNPFFAGEVARLQASRGTATGAVPVGVRQVLEHRLARLPQESVELLRLASVVGAPDVSRLVSVTGMSETEIRRLLSEPETAGVVARGLFVHDLMRETLYTGMSTDVRARLHRQVAEHLQADGPAELMWHWSLASGDDARQRARQLAVVAGDLAMAGLAHDQAVAHYRLALRLGAGDLAVRRRLGEAQVMAGDLGAGRDTLRAVARRAREAGDGTEIAYAVLAMGGGIGGFEVDLLDSEQAPLLDETLRLLPAEDSALRAAVLARLSLVGARTASPDERAGLAQDAAAMARRVGDTAAEVAALAAFCDAWSGPAHVEARIDRAERMLTLAGGQALLELLARRIRVRARLELGDLIGVDGDIEGYARVADRLRSPTYGWLVPMWRGMRAVLDGDLERGSRYADDVARDAGAAQSTNALMMSWALRWRIARLRGDVPAMAELLGLIEPWWETYPSWSCTFALIHAESGQLEQARRHVRRVMDAGLDSIPVDSEWVELLWSLAEAALLLEERDTVRAVHAALEPYANRWAVDGYGAACFGSVGDLLSRLDDHLGRRTAAPPDGAAFIRTGAFWRLEFRGRAITVPDSKGMRDLAALLRHPGRQIHVLDLVEAAGGAPRNTAESDLGPLLDAAARASYKRRLVGLEDDIEEAARNADLGRLDQLQSERDFLAAELAAALGLGGRPRLAGDRVDKARKAVAMRIGTALKGIETGHPELARHLRNGVSTGRSCSYHPDHVVLWRFAGTD